MLKISAVLFDYGLVLCGPPQPDAWERMKSVLKANEPDFHAAYWKHRHDYDRGTTGAASYWLAVAATLGQPQLSAEAVEILTEADVTLWAEPNPAMIAWADGLQRAGVRTGVLSNIGDAMETGLLARLPWLSRFDHFTFSHRLKLAKPEAAIYAHAITGLGVPAAEILFVDDREENVAGARDAGMTAVLYLSHEQFTAEMQALGLGSLLSPVA